MSATLVTHMFKNSQKKFLYTFNELVSLLVELDKEAEQVSGLLFNSARRLLQATQTFLAASDPGDEFAKIRDVQRDAALFKNILDSIANELALAEFTRENLLSEEDAAFLDATLNYCYKAVLTRFVALKKTNNTFYRDHWRNSSLQRLIMDRKQNSEFSG